MLNNKRNFLGIVCIKMDEKRFRMDYLMVRKKNGKELIFAGQQD